MKKKFSETDRLNAAKSIPEGKHSIGEVSRRLGTDYKQIKTWLQFYQAHGVCPVRAMRLPNKTTDLSSVVMIGDRKHDIIGAKNVGIDSIGVLYGFGDYKGLSDAGADYIVEDIPALRKRLLKK